jgi:hypothetical protein
MGEAPQERVRGRNGAQTKGMNFRALSNRCGIDDVGSIPRIEMQPAFTPSGAVDDKL